MDKLSTMIFLSILTQKETNVIFLGVLKEIHDDGKAIKKNHVCKTWKCILNINSDQLAFCFLPLGVQNTAVIDLEDAVAQKVNAKVDHVHVLQPTVNVTQMFVKIVGLGNVIN